ncbi:MAG: ammonia-forming cytochrome c nitrite reductase subunit c552 [Acidobacteria bacterium]|nr:ammonia-forming cytochrome c nitrite reductase subunit c552 [Acidobacteriota bacterium]
MGLYTGEIRVAGAAKAADDAEYIGSETCKTCHEDSFIRWSKTPMGRAFLEHAKTPLEKRGCEACHGPGKAHVEGGGDVSAIIRFGNESKQTAQEQNDQCLQCHEKGNRMFWRASPHQSRGLACVDCHQTMSEKKESLSGEARFNSPLTDVQSTRVSQPELCLRCHQMRRAQLQRSSHMPFREGKVTCTSCHNPHGTPNPKQLIQATLNENCYSCHAERRGPYLWEHPPVLESCGNCHEPHGSTNPQLLRVRTPKLCQQCHNDGQHRSTAYASVMPSAGNGTPAGFNNRVVNRGCANCHARIHGSNHPSGNYFTR